VTEHRRAEDNQRALSIEKRNRGGAAEGKRLV
jgi:hypothetical protein